MFHTSFSLNYSLWTQQSAKIHPQKLFLLKGETDGTVRYILDTKLFLYIQQGIFPATS